MASPQYRFGCVLGYGDKEAAHAVAIYKARGSFEFFYYVPANGVYKARFDPARCLSKEIITNLTANASGYSGFTMQAALFLKTD